MESTHLWIVSVLMLEMFQNAQILAAICRFVCVNLIHVCETIRFICGSHSIYLSICLIFVNLFTFICGS